MFERVVEHNRGCQLHGRPRRAGSGNELAWWAAGTGVAASVIAAEPGGTGAGVAGNDDPGDVGKLARSSRRALKRSLHPERTRSTSSAYRAHGTPTSLKERKRARRVRHPHLLANRERAVPAAGAGLDSGTRVAVKRSPA